VQHELRSASQAASTSSGIARWAVAPRHRGRVLFLSTRLACGDRSGSMLRQALRGRRPLRRFWAALGPASGTIGAAPAAAEQRARWQAGATPTSERCSSSSALLAGLAAAAAGTAWGGMAAALAEPPQPPGVSAVQHALDRAWQHVVQQRGAAADPLAAPPEARLGPGGQLSVTVPLPAGAAAPHELQRRIRTWASQLAGLGYHVSSRSSYSSSTAHGPTVRTDWELLPADQHGASIRLRLYVPPQQSGQQPSLQISKQGGYSDEELELITALVQELLLSGGGGGGGGGGASIDDPAFQVRAPRWAGRRAS
jgi:hypothetical protein